MPDRPGVGCPVPLTCLPAAAERRDHHGHQPIRAARGRASRPGGVGGLPVGCARESAQPGNVRTEFGRSLLLPRQPVLRSLTVRRRRLKFEVPAPSRSNRHRLQHQRFLGGQGEREGLARLEPVLRRRRGLLPGRAEHVSPRRAGGSSNASWRSTANWAERSAGLRSTRTPMRACQEAKP